MSHLVPVLIASILVVAVYFVILYVMYQEKLNSDTAWVGSLDAKRLREFEREVEKEGRKRQISLDETVDVEELIGKEHYRIVERILMPFHEASISPRRPIVYVRKWLSPERRRFALTHELMHIWFDQDAENAGARYRDAHSIFHRRTTEEQDIDYRAACLIMNEKTFVEDLNKAEYFSSSKDKRRETIYALSGKYKVAPDAVARRICEINKLYNESEANRIH